MKTKRPHLKFFGCTLAVLVLAILPGCKSGPQVSSPSGAQYAFDFETLKPVAVTPEQEKRFVAALEKYAVASESRIFSERTAPGLAAVERTQIWPPSSKSLVTTNVAAGSGDHGGVAAIVATRGSGEGVRRTRGVESIVATRGNSQHIAFRTEADLRAFLRVVGR